MMLSVTNLHVEVEGKAIIKGLDLQLDDGEVHAIMGPNGSGKSTLSYVLAGRDGYRVTQGEVRFRGEDLLVMDTETRARKGVFLAMQYPVELPGVNNMTFLRESLNAMRRARNECDIDTGSFLRLAKLHAEQLGLDPALLNRNVNVGFSGGEKKRNEILQMTLLNPALAILDETDSGLDIDALRIIADGVNALRGPEHAILLITHYQRLLEHVEPDRVHVLAEGRIVKSGGKELALELEEKGYAMLGLDDNAPAAA